MKDIFLSCIFLMIIAEFLGLFLVWGVGGCLAFFFQTAIFTKMERLGGFGESLIHVTVSLRISVIGGASAQEGNEAVEGPGE